MPFPIIVIPIAIGIGAAIAGVAGIVSSSDRKRIVILGPRSSGKSTWTRYMVDGEIAYTYEPSALATDLKASIDLKGRELPLRIQAQVGSTDYAMTGWHRAAEKADGLFYLADLSRMNDRSYMEIVEQHARIMARWSHRTEGLTLVLTHLDQTQGFPQIDFSTVLDQPEVVQARQKLGAYRVVVGHLADHDGAHALTYAALQPLVSKDGEDR